MKKQILENNCTDSSKYEKQFFKYDKSLQIANKFESFKELESNNQVLTEIQPSYLNTLINISDSKQGINHNKDKDNIKVTARIRPRNHKEGENCNLIDAYDNIIKLKNKPEEIFVFDYVATEEVSQEKIFQMCAKDVADNFLIGYNGTIFAYGQTSAGKTYTLIGSREIINDKINKNINTNINNNFTGNNNSNNNTNSLNTNLNSNIFNNNFNVNSCNNSASNEIKKYLNLGSEKRGIIPRAIEYILKNVEKNDENTTISLCCSFLEIYNEELRDLLDDKSLNKKIEIREILENQEEDKLSAHYKGKNNNIIRNSQLVIPKLQDKKLNYDKAHKIINISNLLKLKFENYNEAIQYLAQGLERRKVGETRMNEESSRSHAIFSIYLENKQRINNNVKTKKSVFHMVDLAGSERQSDTGASGARLNESGNINNSLMVLKMVIENLDSSKKCAHIPYRDSKLTFALKDSLGGNSKTCIITNISPANSNNQETYSTLQFGKLARRVKNEAKINEELYTDFMFEQVLLHEKEKNRKLTSENMKLIEKQKEIKKNYEKLYDKMILISKNSQNKNIFCDSNNIDIHGYNQDFNSTNNTEEIKNTHNCINSNHEYDPNLIFALNINEFESISNNQNKSSINYPNLNKNTNMNSPFNNISKINPKFNINNNYIRSNIMQKSLNDDSTREDYKITYENCFKELERLQEEIADKEKILIEKQDTIETLYIDILEKESIINYLKKDLENLDQKNKKLCLDYKNGDTDLTSIMLQNSLHEKEIQKLQETIEDKKNEISRQIELNAINENSLKSQIQRIEEYLEAKKKEIHIERESKFQKDKVIKSLENELDIQNNKIKNLNERLEITESEKKEFNTIIEDLKKLVEKKDTEIEELRNQKFEISEKGKNLIQFYEESLENKEIEKGKLEEELKNKRNNLDEASNLLAKIKTQYCLISRKYEEIENLNGELNIDLAFYKKTNEDLKVTNFNLQNNIESLNNDINELTKLENPKAKKINLIEKLRNNNHNLQKEVEKLRIKETQISNLISKIKIHVKNSNKLMTPEQIENHICQIEKNNEEFKNCIEKALEKMDLIFYKSSKSDHAYFFRNKHLENNSKINDSIHNFNDNFDKIHEFIDYLLRNEQVNKEKIKNKNTIIDNLNKILKLNDYQNIDSKNLNHRMKDFSITQKVEEYNFPNIDKNEENNGNYSKETNLKNSQIIEMFLKTQNESNIKNVKLGNKRKSSELLNGNTFLNYQDLININTVENKLNNDTFNHFRNKIIQSERKENKFYFNFDKNFKFDPNKENKCPNTELRKFENINNKNFNISILNENKNNLNNTDENYNIINKKMLNDIYQFNRKNTDFSTMGQIKNSINRVDDFEYLDEDIKFVKNKEIENYDIDKYNRENIYARVSNNELIDSKNDSKMDDLMDIVNLNKG